MGVNVEHIAVVTPSETEAEELDTLKRALAAIGFESAALESSNTAGLGTEHVPQTVSRPTLIGPDGSLIPIPLSVSHLLYEIVHAMTRGESVSLVPRDRELTTQEAADILNISRPFLIRLLDRGEIPFQKTGTHRRIRLEDVLQHAEDRKQERQKAINRLADKAQELGKY